MFVIAEDRHLLASFDGSDRGRPACGPRPLGREALRAPPEQYEEMRDAQGDCCAICQVPFDGPGACAVDHDHATGKVRGMLCGRCNRAIGLLRDDPEIMRQAADYIERTTPPGQSSELRYSP